MDVSQDRTQNIRNKLVRFCYLFCKIKISYRLTQYISVKKCMRHSYVEQKKNPVSAITVLDQKDFASSTNEIREKKASVTFIAAELIICIEFPGVFISLLPRNKLFDCAVSILPNYAAKFGLESPPPTYHRLNCCLCHILTWRGLKSTEYSRRVFSRMFSYMLLQNNKYCQLK